MRHIKTEEQKIIQKLITIELTDEELKYIVVALGEMTDDKANDILKDSYSPEYEFNDFDSYGLWEDLRELSGLYV